MNEAIWKTTFAALIAGIAAGCASTDTVVFATKTSVGVDIDFTPGTASIAFDRVEGYFGPRFSSGGAPTVVGAFVTEGTGLNRTVRQIYATGQAALGATGATLNPAASDLKGQAEPMFFGTATTWGLKLSTQNAAVNSLSFGYKRKEASLIPLSKANDSGVFVYPSVLASIDGSYAATGTTPNPTTGVTQYFATGAAADRLSQQPLVQRLFQSLAEEALLKYREQERLQRRTAMNLVYCLTDLDDAKLDEVWDNAKAMKVFADPVVTDFKRGPAKRARTSYADKIRFIDADNSEHSSQLHQHEAFVCGLSGKIVRR